VSACALSESETHRDKSEFAQSSAPSESIEYNTPIHFFDSDQHLAIHSAAAELDRLAALAAIASASWESSSDP